MSLHGIIRRKVGEDHPFLGYTPQFSLEPNSRTDGSDSNSLAMRIADPLWMLGRQWQFGEFLAEDNGSPINVSINYNKEKAAYYSVGNSPTKYPILDAPLEAKIEAMNPSSEPSKLDLKSKVRIGKKFEKMAKLRLPDLGSDLMLFLRELYKFEEEEGMDDSSLRFLRMIKGKVMNGGKLMQHIIEGKSKWKNSNNRTVKELDLSAIELEKWYKEFYVLPDSNKAWNQNKLAHEFKVHENKGNSNLFTLNAPDYQSGHLDWYSFDTATVKNKVVKEENLTQSEKFIPINVSFPSMPNKRLFTFEDSKIDLTKMDVEPGELIKTMMIDFSLVSGSDWYTIPMDMDVGELCWVTEIEVTDVFGVTTKIANTAENGAKLNEDSLLVWDVFKIRDRNIDTYTSKDHFMFLAPVTSMRMESEPLEELLFLRDEYANMVWAIEKRVTNAMGKSVDGYDQHLEIQGPFLTPGNGNGSGLPQYRLASTVPFNWIPFIPALIDGNSNQIRLKKGLMMRNEDESEAGDSAIKALSSLLQNEDINNVQEEAIPKAGVRVQVTNQRVRWTDGKTYVWRGRKVLAGKGEGNSGLQFDYLREIEKETTG